MIKIHPKKHRTIIASFFLKRSRWKSVRFYMSRNFRQLAYNLQQTNVKICYIAAYSVILNKRNTYFSIEPSMNFAWITEYAIYRYDKAHKIRVANFYIVLFFNLQHMFFFFHQNLIYKKKVEGWHFFPV